MPTPKKEPFDWVRGKHKHRWVTTHTNKWMIPTAQECSTCNMTRKVDVNATDKDLHYCWVYGDGKVSDPIPLGEMGNE